MSAENTSAARASELQSLSSQVGCPWCRVGPRRRHAEWCPHSAASRQIVREQYAVSYEAGQTAVDRLHREAEIRRKEIEFIFGLLTEGHERVSWEQHGDLMRTQLQETGRIRLYFITLADLWAVVDDLGIDPARVHFREGYAEVRDAD